jgi:hypothetical protein
MMAAEPKPLGSHPKVPGWANRGNAKSTSRDGGTNANAGTRKELESTHLIVEEIEREDVMIAEDKYVEVVLDSGAIDHIANPSHLPDDCKVIETAESRAREFVNASGKTIPNYGEAKVTLADQDTNNVVGCKFQVADVTRMLHATGPICDTRKEVLYTSTQAVVVSEGTFSKLLKDAKVLARYPRKGKLYTAQMKISSMRKREPDKRDDPKDAGFPRQGSRR